jgi:hypothetical protein
MQQQRKQSFLKSILGAKQVAKNQAPRKSPSPLDERQLRQVAGGGGETNSPKGTW